MLITNMLFGLGQVDSSIFSMFLAEGINPVLARRRFVFITFGSLKHADILPGLAR